MQISSSVFFRPCALDDFYCYDTLVIVNFLPLSLGLPQSAFVDENVLYLQ